MTPPSDDVTRMLRVEKPSEASAFARVSAPERCIGSKSLPKHLTARGLFVTIEGIEGAGKTTLADALAARLSDAGREVVATREPGGTAVGDSIRKLLLEFGEGMSDRAELLLFEAARAQHVDCVIAPAVERGAVVICDRFADSTTAYQAGARGIDAETVARLNEFSTRGIRPDLTILLDLPASVGLARQRLTDRISTEGLAFHESVRQTYLQIARAEPERVVVIDARQAVDAVIEQTWEAIVVRYGPSFCSSAHRQAHDAQNEPAQD